MGYKIVMRRRHGRGVYVWEEIPSRQNQAGTYKRKRDAVVAAEKLTGRAPVKVVKEHRLLWNI